MGLRHLPYAFTEDGIAIKVNIQIIRMFSRFRRMVLSHTDILLKLGQLENMGLKHDRRIELIFEYLNQFEKSRQDEFEFKNHPRIGFKSSKRF